MIIEVLSFDQNPVNSNERVENFNISIKLKKVNGKIIPFGKKLIFHEKFGSTSTAGMFI